MTYRQLQRELSRLTEFQLDCDVTIFAHQMGEFFGASLFINNGDDILDDQHPYISHIDLNKFNR
jgi:hypothetical protein